MAGLVLWLLLAPVPARRGATRWPGGGRSRRPPATGGGGSAERRRAPGRVPVLAGAGRLLPRRSGRPARPRGAARPVADALDRLPATLVPYLEPSPRSTGTHPTCGRCCPGRSRSWRWSAPWYGRAAHRDAAIVIVPVYLAETLLWPYVNERRVILVLPVLAAWYVLGAKAIGRAAWTRRGPPAPPLRGAGDRRPGVGGAAAGRGPGRSSRFGPVAARLPGRPRPGHLALRRVALRPDPGRLGAPADVVETDYLSSTALFTGHETREPCLHSTRSRCVLRRREVRLALAQDDAGLPAARRRQQAGRARQSLPLRGRARPSPWAVQLLRTDRDNASVFELIGPGTGHPDLHDLTAARPPPPGGPRANGTSVLEWDWGTPGAGDARSVSARPGARATSTVRRRPDAKARWAVAHRRPPRPRRSATGRAPPRICWPAWRDRRPAGCGSWSPEAEPPRWRTCTRLGPVGVGGAGRGRRFRSGDVSSARLARGHPASPGPAAHGLQRRLGGGGGDGRAGLRR